MILVTGARGTVGSEVVRQLQAKGGRFKVASREPGKAPAGLEAVVFDLDRPDTLPAALEGIDTVFLLSNVVTSELNAVKAAPAAGVKRIVKLSAWGAGEEAFSFARWHRQVEKAIEASGLRWTHLRPNGFMQNVVNYTGTTIRREGAIYLPAGEARISHVDVRD